MLTVGGSAFWVLSEMVPALVRGQHARGKEAVWTGNGHLHFKALSVAVDEHVKKGNTPVRYSAEKEVATQPSCFAWSPKFHSSQDILHSTPGPPT